MATGNALLSLWLEAREDDGEKSGTPLDGDLGKKKNSICRSNYVH